MIVVAVARVGHLTLTAAPTNHHSVGTSAGGGERWAVTVRPGAPVMIDGLGATEGDDVRRGRGCGGVAEERQVGEPSPGLGQGADDPDPAHRVATEGLDGGLVGRGRAGAVMAADPGAGVFDGPGEVRGVLRGIDWAATPLGPVVSWSPVLRTMVRGCLASGFPMVVHWGGSGSRSTTTRSRC